MVTGIFNPPSARFFRQRRISAFGETVQLRVLREVKEKNLSLWERGAPKFDGRFTFTE